MGSPRSSEFKALLVHSSILLQNPGSAKSIQNCNYSRTTLCIPGRNNKKVEDPAGIIMKNRLMFPRGVKSRVTTDTRLLGAMGGRQARGIPWIPGITRIPALPPPPEFSFMTAGAAAAGVSISPSAVLTTSLLMPWAAAQRRTQQAQRSYMGARGDPLRSRREIPADVLQGKLEKRTNGSPPDPEQRNRSSCVGVLVAEVRRSSRNQTSLAMSLALDVCSDVKLGNGSSLVSVDTATAFVNVPSLASSKSSGHCTNANKKDIGCNPHHSENGNEMALAMPYIGIGNALSLSCTNANKKEVGCNPHHSENGNEMALAMPLQKCLPAQYPHSFTGHRFLRKTERKDPQQQEAKLPWNYATRELGGLFFFGLASTFRVHGGGGGGGGGDSTSSRIIQWTPRDDVFISGWWTSDDGGRQQASSVTSVIYTLSNILIFRKNIPPSESSLDERNYEEFYKQKISHTPVKTLEKLSTGEDQDLAHINEPRNQLRGQCCNPGCATDDPLCNLLLRAAFVIITALSSQYNSAFDGILIFNNNESLCCVRRYYGSAEKVMSPVLTGFVVLAAMAYC
ncbi:unnamed protein product, partial [Notodromas monacha]